MFELFKMDSPGFSKWDLMAYLKDPEPSKYPTTATDKLYKAEYEYRESLVLANAAKHRYKQDHEALHTEMRFGERGNFVNSTFMCRERNTWLECITKAKAVKKQIPGLRKLVAEENQAGEESNAVSKDVAGEEH